jgi:F420H(2)-dependent quinone reductase
MLLQGEFAKEKAGWVRRQLDKIDESGSTRSVDVMGRRVTVFTIRGRKSGKLRRVPLMRVEHGGKFLAVASKGGSDHHPEWYLSLRENPEVEVHDDTEHFLGFARELSDDERAEWWERAVEAFPPYADYQKGTKRLIPVLLVEPNPN